MKVSIIGSSGRNGLIKNVTPRMYRNMVDVAYHYLCGIASSNNISVESLICSGAITLYLENKISNLELHFPCHFEASSSEFHSHDNTSKSANLYHRNFSNIVGINSLYEIS